VTFLNRWSKERASGLGSEGGGWEPHGSSDAEILRAQKPGPRNKGKRKVLSLCLKKVKVGKQQASRRGGIELDKEEQSVINQPTQVRGTLQEEIHRRTLKLFGPWGERRHFSGRKNPSPIAKILTQTESEKGTSVYR